MPVLFGLIFLAVCFMLKQHRGENLRRGFIRRAELMRIDHTGGLNACVTESGRYGFDIHAACDQHGSVGMPQGMNMDRRQVVLFNKIRKPFGYGVGMKGLAELICKNEIRKLIQIAVFTIHLQYTALYLQHCRKEFYRKALWCEC